MSRQVLRHLSLAMQRVLLALLCLLLVGCQGNRHGLSTASEQSLTMAVGQGLSSPMYLSTVRAVCVPPDGWLPEPLKQSSNHTHQVWLSPTGKTAYGVIHFRMPLPVGAELALRGYLRAMRQSEGDAILLDRQSDADLPGIRFVAEGGLYRTRSNLIVSGRDGWAVYAGTLRDRDVLAEELDLAERAREHTRVGRP